MSESGVHRPHVAGIHGREDDSTYSIVLSGGYDDDQDNGEEFTYSGSGGRDLSGNKRTAKQSMDQKLTAMNRYTHHWIESVAVTKVLIIRFQLFYDFLKARLSPFRWYAHRSLVNNFQYYFYITLFQPPHAYPPTGRLLVRVTAPSMTRQGVVLGSGQTANQ